jgi:hypothetical protein
LVIPQRKMALVKAFHGTAAMAGVGAPWPAMGSSPERKGGGRGRGGGRGPGGREEVKREWRHEGL